MSKEETLYDAVTTAINVYSKTPRAVKELEYGDIILDQSNGLKYDEGKLRMDLIPPIAYEALGRILTYGAGKYKDNSWQGVSPERYRAALIRHFVAYLKDPNGVDEESGFKHIEHCLCNAMFLCYFSEEECKKQ